MNQRRRIGWGANKRQPEVIRAAIALRGLLLWMMASFDLGAEIIPLTMPEASSHAGGREILLQVADGVETGPGGWSVAPQLSEPQALVLRCAQPVDTAELEISLFFLAGKPHHSIAEFSLSYTNDPEPSLNARWMPLVIQRFTAEVTTLQRTAAGHLRAMEPIPALLTGSTPDDTYRIGVFLPTRRATGFRLVVFPVKTSADGRPGMSWGRDRDFVLTEFRAKLRERMTTNIALHCPVVASHRLFWGMVPDALTDGLPGTIAHPWEEENHGPDFHFTLDLGRSTRIDHLGLRTRGDMMFERFSRVRMRLYEDDPAAGVAPQWVGMVRADGSIPPAGSVEIVRSPMGIGDFRGRYLRISSESRIPGSPQLAEVEVYETRTPEVVAVLADGRQIELSKGINIPPKVRRLSIQLRIPNIGLPPQDIFRWRVRGESDIWQSSRLMTIDLPRPVPGKTWLEAQALHSDGHWDQSMLSLPIVTRQRLWENTVFQALAALAVLAAAMGLVRVITNRRAARQLTLAQARAALAEERTRIARDLHDDLGANLALICFQADLAERTIGNPDRVRIQLDKIYQTASDLTKQLGSMVWAVDPVNDTLESLARHLHGHAGEYLGMAGVRCRFTSIDEMPELQLTSAFRHHLLMIVKEALHNVVSHSGATLVTFDVRLENDRLVLELADNGRGMPTADQLKHGNGLANMRKRAEILGGTCEILKPENESGTLIRLVLPVKSSPHPRH